MTPKRWRNAVAAIPWVLFGFSYLIDWRAAAFATMGMAAFWAHEVIKETLGW